MGELESTNSWNNLFGNENICIGRKSYILNERAIFQLNILGQREQFFSSYILTLVGKKSKIVDELSITHHP